MNYFDQASHDYFCHHCLLSTAFYQVYYLSTNVCDFTVSVFGHHPCVYRENVENPGFGNCRLTGVLTTSPGPHINFESRGGGHSILPSILSLNKFL